MKPSLGHTLCENLIGVDVVAALADDIAVVYWSSDFCVGNAPRSKSEFRGNAREHEPKNHGDQLILGN
jgi:hypothetical protein